MMAKAKTFVRLACCSKMEPRATGKPNNSSVLNILPVTTFRTIDLEGKEISDPSFSRFCAKESVFFESKSSTGQQTSLRERHELMGFDNLIGLGSNKCSMKSSREQNCVPNHFPAFFDKIGSF